MPNVVLEIKDIILRQVKHCGYTLNVNVIKSDLPAFH